MSTHVVEYKMSEASLSDMKYLSTGCMIAEQASAIAKAFSDIELTIEVDDDWGICRITHVNGREVADD